MIKKILISSLVSIFALVTMQISFALVDEGEVESIECTELSYTMRLGSRDANTNGQVSTLQTYLSQANYLESDPTGYFGRATKKAVQDFQKANGITPNGNVGPYTKAKIKEVSCGSSSTSNSKKINITAEEGNIPAFFGETYYKGKLSLSILSIDYKYSFNETDISIVDGKYYYKVTKNIPSGVYKYSISPTLDNDVIVEGILTIKNSLTNPLSEVGSLKIYLNGSSSVYKSEENVIKEYALRECKSFLDMKIDSVRCTWKGDQIYYNSKAGPQIISTSATQNTIDIKGDISSSDSILYPGLNYKVLDLVVGNNVHKSIKEITFTIKGNVENNLKITAASKTVNVISNSATVFDSNIPLQDNLVIPVYVSVDPTYLIPDPLNSSQITVSKIVVFEHDGNVKEFNTNIISKQLNIKTAKQKAKYLGYVSGANNVITTFIETDNISKEDALANCTTNYENRLRENNAEYKYVRCTWDGVEIFAKAMSVTTTSTNSNPEIKNLYVTSENTASGMRYKVSLSTTNTLSCRATLYKDISKDNWSVLENSVYGEVYFYTPVLSEATNAKVSVTCKSLDYLSTVTRELQIVTSPVRSY